MGARLEALPRARIAVVPCGKRTAHLPDKHFPAEQWAALLPRLTGGPERSYSSAPGGMGPVLPAGWTCANPGYRRTAAILARCALLLTPVGGLTPLAAAMGTRSMALHGGADHPVVGGYHWNLDRFFPIECGPCSLAAHCEHHSWMRRLTIADVMDTLREALAKPPPPIP